MPCNSNVFAYSAPCDPQPGGIKSILVAAPAAVKLATLNPAGGTCSLAPVTSNTKPFYRWDVAPGQSTLETQAQINEANNVRFFATDLVAALNGFSPTSAGAALLYRLHRLAIIVELNNGNSVFIGLVHSSIEGDERPSDQNGCLVRGADVTAFTWTPGQAKSDAVRATITAHIDAALLPLSVSNYSNLVNE